MVERVLGSFWRGGRVVLWILGRYCVLWSFLGGWQWVYGDIYVLKNGRRIRGLTLREEGDRVLVGVPGGRIWLRWSQLEAIYKQSLEEYYREEAEYFYGRGDYAQAVVYYRKLRERCPKLGREGMIRSYIRMVKRDIGRGYYRRARRNLGIVLRWIGGRTEMWEGLRRRVEEELRRREELWRRVESLEARGRWREALGIWRVLEREFPEWRGEVFRRLGRCYLGLADWSYRRGDYGEARRWYREAFLRDISLLGVGYEGYIGSVLGLVEGWNKGGKFARSLRHLYELHYLFPLDWRVIYSYGETYYRMGRYVEALDWYRKILGKGGSKGGAIPIDELRRRARRRVLGWSVRKVWSVVGGGKVGDGGGSGGWLRLRGDFFVILYRRGYRGVAELFRRYLEFYYWRLEGVLRPFIRVSFLPLPEIYLCSGRGRLGLLLGKRVGGVHLGGYLEVRENFGSISRLRWYVDLGYGLVWNRTIPHFLGHIFLEYMYRYSSLMPLWLKEGFAGAMEPAVFQRHYEVRVHALLVGGGKLDIDWFLGFCSDILPGEDFLVWSVSAFRYLSSRMDLGRCLRFLGASTGGGMVGVLGRFTGHRGGYDFLADWWSWQRRSRVMVEGG